jgi:hypothetical protein
VVHLDVAVVELLNIETPRSCSAFGGAQIAQYAEFELFGLTAWAGPNLGTAKEKVAKYFAPTAELVSVDGGRCRVGHAD